MQHQPGSVFRHGTRMTFLIAVLWTTAMSVGCDRAGARRSTSTSPGLTVPTGPGPSGPAGPSGPTGSYALTLTVSPTCATGTDADGETRSFPDFLQVRRYDATFANGAAILKATDGTGNQVPIGGIDRYFAYGKPLMTMKDGELTILVLPERGLDFHGVPSCEIDGYAWYEAVSPGAAFMLCGTWRGSTADPVRIEGTIDGTFEYQSSGPEALQHLRCHATDHHFALTVTGQSSAR